MSGIISLDVEQTEKSLRIISDNLTHLLSGIKSLEGQAESAFKESNLTFYQAIQTVYGESALNLSKLAEVISDLHGGVLRYQKEIQEYEQSRP